MPQESGHIASVGDIGPRPASDGPHDQSEGEPTSPMSTTSERPQRQQRPPARVQDYVCFAITKPSSPPAQSAPLSTSHPLEHYIAYDKFSPQYRAFLATITSRNEPQYYTQVVQDPHWSEAMTREISALEENNTWEYAVLLLGKRAFGSKWVYIIK